MMTLILTIDPSTSMGFCIGDKETGKISDSVIEKSSDQLNTQTLNKVKSDKLNSFYHANKDLTQTDRNKLTALLADQVEGGLDFKSVMDLSNNPSLMDLQAKNIQLRSSEISKKMKSIQEQQDELDNNEQFLDDGVQDYEWNYKSSFTNKEIEDLEKTHIITYDFVQVSNEDTRQTEVIIFKEKEIMAHTVMTMVENIHSQMQEVLNDNVNKLDIQNALYQLEEVRDILNDMGAE